MDEAVNEALANALIHSYYGNPCTILVRLEPHKLTISNPGNLLMDKSVAIAGGYSETRNPTLMRIFNFINVSDRAGSGLQKIWSSWQDAFGQIPTMEEQHLPARIALTLPFDNTDIDKAISSYATLPETGNTRLIYDMVCASGSKGLSSAEIAAKSSIPKRSVQRVLKDLYDQKLLSRDRKNREWVYSSPEAVQKIPEGSEADQ